MRSLVSSPIFREPFCRQRMTRVRFYSAISLDGFIADSDGDSDWLEPYKASVFQTSGFLNEIGAVVMGRRTFEVLRAFDDWPYGNMRCFVLSSQTPRDLPDNCVFVRDGIHVAVSGAVEATSKDVWVVGGAMTMQSALEARLVDSIEVCLAPVMLGAGLSILGGLAERQTFDFDGISTFPEDVIKLRYLRKD